MSDVQGRLLHVRLTGCMAGSAGMLGMPAPPPLPGFGCANPDYLAVKRVSNDVIEFPGCAEFPFPLRRCPNLLHCGKQHPNQNADDGKDNQEFDQCKPLTM